MEHNSRHSKHSLHRFLNQRYLAIFIFLIITFIVVILFMRHSAMDDTTDYYMYYDAQVMTEYYQVSDDIVEFDAGIKEYYWGISRLPLRYQKLLNISINDENENENLKSDETQLYQLDNKFVYILPYYSIEKGETFFVIHFFDLKNETLFYQSWQNVFILLVALGLFLVIFYSLHTNRKITQQMDDFHHWVKSMADMNYVQLKQQKPPKNLNFEELINSAESLQVSLITQHELRQNEQVLLAREKHFLSSLSHELRTPISIISAALTLLKKSDAITVKDREKLVKLSNANLSMKQLTSTLLQLWRGQQNLKHTQAQSQLDNKVFLLDELVELAVSNCQQQFKRREISFFINTDENTKLFTQYELAEILINNLLRNACQYSVDGKVRVEIRQHHLLVENCVADIINAEGLSPISIKSSEASEVSYGYGLGLFLAEQICQQQQWQLNISSTAQLFTVTVNFNNADEPQTLG